VVAGSRARGQIAARGKCETQGNREFTLPTMPEATGYGHSDVTAAMKVWAPQNGRGCPF
jgi:hypothetical protein